MKHCIYCAEEIQDAAIKCRFCNELQQPARAAAVSQHTTARSTSFPGSATAAGILWLVNAGLGLLQTLGAAASEEPIQAIVTLAFSVAFLVAGIKTLNRTASRRELTGYSVGTIVLASFALIPFLAGLPEALLGAALGYVNGGLGLACRDRYESFLSSGGV